MSTCCKLTVNELYFEDEIICSFDTKLVFLSQYSVSYAATVNWMWQVNFVLNSAERMCISLISTLRNCSDNRDAFLVYWFYFTLVCDVFLQINDANGQEPSGRHSSHPSCLPPAVCLRVYEYCIKKSAAKRENKSAHSWVCMCVCVSVCDTYADTTRYSYVKCIFGPLHWPRHRWPPRQAHLTVASQSDNSFTGRLLLLSSDFPLALSLRFNRHP